MRRPCRSGCTPILARGAGTAQTCQARKRVQGPQHGSATPKGRRLCGQLPEEPGSGHWKRNRVKVMHPLPTAAISALIETQPPSTASAQEAEAGVTGAGLAGPSLPTIVSTDHPEQSGSKILPDPQRPIRAEMEPIYVQFASIGSAGRNGHVDEFVATVVRIASEYLVEGFRTRPIILRGVHWVLWKERAGDTRDGDPTSAESR